MHSNYHIQFLCPCRCCTDSTSQPMPARHFAGSTASILDPSGSQESTHVIPTAKGNLHADSSTYMSLSDNRGPESVYQSLQSSEITADPQYSNSGNDEPLTYMSLNENREDPNVYQSLQHTTKDTDVAAEYELPTFT